MNDYLVGYDPCAHISDGPLLLLEVIGVFKYEGVLQGIKLARHRRTPQKNLWGSDAISFKCSLIIISCVIHQEALRDQHNSTDNEDREFAVKVPRGNRRRSASADFRQEHWSASGFHLETSVVDDKPP